MPTSEWNAATSWGMAVMAMRRAMDRPTTAPAAMAASTQPMPNWKIAGFHMVVSTAISMPIMPKMLPRLLVSGLDRPRRAMMNRTAAIR